MTRPLAPLERADSDDGPDDLERRLTERLRSHKRERLHVPGFRQAAVLVPILRAPGGPEVLLTVRASTLRSHAGQIAFPGGRLEPGESVTAAARRETHEEVGLTVPEEAVLGMLDDQLSPARFVVTPVVAWLSAAEGVLCAAEVSEVFRVPLRELMTLTSYTEERRLENIVRQIHFYRWQERLIWGMTGNILHNMLALLTDFIET